MRSPLFFFFLVPALLAAPVLAASWSDGVAIVVYGGQYGTGWWVAENTLVTAAHVVAWTENATVQVVRGDWSTTGFVVYVDRKTDIAVVKTESTPPGAYVFPVASRVEELKTLYVIGYPYEIVQLAGDLGKASEDPRVAEGFAAWYNRDYHLIEFQATTDAGNSGGPVVYANGAVAGLVSFALSGKAGTLYFASDADAIRKALDAAGVSYTVLDPPSAMAGGRGVGSGVADLASPEYFRPGFVFWSAVISLIVSIVVTVAWAARQG